MKTRNSLIRFTQCLFAALVAVTLIVSALPASALASDAIPYGTPSIDGVIDPIWSGSSNKIAVDMLYEGDDKHCTGYARLMWDESFLYVLGYAYDTTKSVKQENIYYETDGFEVFLDERNAHNSVKNEISQFRINRNGSLSGMLMSAAVGEAGILAEYKTTKWAAAEAPDGYFVEFAIPWTRISGAGKGTQIGIEFQINDDYDNNSSTDSIINSEVIDKWLPSTYRIMTLSSTKAEASASGTQSEPGVASQSGGQTAPAATSSGNTAAVSSNESTGTGSSEITDTSSDNSTVITDADVTAASEPEQTTGEAQEETSGMPKSVKIAIIAVAAVVILAVAVCLLLVLKPKKKAPAKNTESANDSKDE